jgi:hypothetical protein
MKIVRDEKKATGYGPGLQAEQLLLSSVKYKALSMSTLVYSTLHVSVAIA